LPPTTQQTRVFIKQLLKIHFKQVKYLSRIVFYTLKDVAHRKEKHMHFPRVDGSGKHTTIGLET